MEELSDQLCDDITHHLVLCSTEKISKDSANSVSAMLHIANELENSCDACYRLVMQVRRKYRKERTFIAKTEMELIDFSTIVRKSMQFCHDHIVGKVDPKELEFATELEHKIDDVRKTLRKKSISRMADEDSVKRELICLTLISELETIGNNCLNISQALNRKTPGKGYRI